MELLEIVGSTMVRSHTDEESRIWNFLLVQQSRKNTQNAVLTLPHWVAQGKYGLSVAPIDCGSTAPKKRSWKRKSLEKARRQFEPGRSFRQNVKAGQYEYDTFTCEKQDQMLLIIALGIASNLASAMHKVKEYRSLDTVCVE
ncbi:uncharacterized protein V6R79_020610 [Siganus canaliculatus]